MGNAPASVRWMDNLSRAQTYLALGKRIQLDPAGNGPQHLNNYTPTAIQPPWGDETATPTRHRHSTKITSYVLALIQDNVGEPTERSLFQWGHDHTGRPWRRILEDFGAFKTTRLAKEMKAPNSPLRAVLLAMAYDIAMGTELTLILGVAGAGKTR